MLEVPRRNGHGLHGWTPERAEREPADQEPRIRVAAAAWRWYCGQQSVSRVPGASSCPCCSTQRAEAFGEKTMRTALSPTLKGSLQPLLPSLSREHSH